MKKRVLATMLAAVRRRSVRGRQGRQTADGETHQGADPLVHFLTDRTGYPRDLPEHQHGGPECHEPWSRRIRPGLAYKVQALREPFSV